MNPNSDKYGKEYTDGPRARNYPNRCLVLDPHELLKKEILSQGTGSVASGDNFRSNFNDMNSPLPTDKNSIVVKDDSSIIKEQIGVSDRYFRFNSGDAVSSNRAVSQFTFSITNRNVNFPIQNIISVSVDDFYFPNVITPAIYPDTYFYQRITMTIQDFPDIQSIRSVNNFRYHFEFNMNNAGIMQYLTPVNKKFIFTQPIRDLSQITVQFRDPENVLTLPEEFVAIVPIPGTSPAQFTLPANNPFVASTTYSITFINYTSSDPTTTATLLSRPGGQLGTTNGLNTILTISDPATAIGAAEANAAIIQVMQNSFSFTLRFRTIMDTLTNYITPV